MSISMSHPVLPEEPQGNASGKKRKKKLMKAFKCITPGAPRGKSERLLLKKKICRKIII